MSDPLPVRIGYRLRFIEDPVAKSLLVEARTALEEGADGLDGTKVLAWLAKNDIRLVPWQIQKLEKL